MGNLIKAQEDYLYVWTLGVKGVGDGWDKLVTHRRESLLAPLREGDPHVVENAEAFRRIVQKAFSTDSGFKEVGAPGLSNTRCR